MTTKHLTDEEIQEYALNPLACETRITGHAVACPECMVRVNEYRLIFDSIKEQLQPAFDFDLAELVVAQLPTETRKAKGAWAIYVALLIVILLAGTGAYLFKDYILSIFSGIGTFVLYLIITTVFTILIVLSMDMYKTFQKKIHALDVY